MSRAKKLFLVTLVLLIGIGLAWPFRKPVGQPSSLGGESARLVTDTDSLMPPGVHSEWPVDPDRRADTSSPHVVAKMASTGDSGTVRSDTSGNLPDTPGFDLANHPVIADASAVAAPPLVTGQTRAAAGEPTHATELEAERTNPDAQWPTQVVHIVRNSDTLEKLAERYLGDAARSLEIFDLNRVPSGPLKNPHLLPIGAELRIPIAPGRAID